MNVTMTIYTDDGDNQTFTVVHKGKKVNTEFVPKESVIIKKIEFGVTG